MGPDFGAGSSMLLFFSLCILQVVLGTGVLSYAAHSFLTIVVDTAAGGDHVFWPAEPFTDWLWKMWYLAWVVAVLLTPLGVILALFKFTVMQISLQVLILFWLVFPVGLLSSLSAPTRWMIFRPVMVWYLLRHFPAAAAFYLSTELLLAGLGGAVYLTRWYPDQMLWAPAVALAAAAALFLYGRLLGRLAWVMNQRKLGKQEELEEIAADAEVQDPWSLSNQLGKEPAQVAPEGSAAEEEPKARRRSRASVEDPWAAPAVDEDPDYWKKGLPLDVQQAGSYDILTQEPPPPAPKARGRNLPSADMYAAEPIKPVERPVEFEVPEVSSKELKLLERTPAPPPPAWPMVSGVWTFLGYPATLAPFLTVALGLWLMGMVLRLQMSFLVL